MPLTNRAPIDASGKLMVTTTTPTAAWPSLGGMTYHPTTGELAVIDAVPAATDPWVGGIRFTNLGSMYVWSAALPAGVEYVGGIPVTDDGRVVVDGSGGAGGIVVGGWPIGSGGGVPVVGLSAQPIFWSVLTNTLVPVIAGNPTFTFTRATTAYVADQDGILRQAQLNESRFQGARRVRNWLADSNNFASVAWNKTSSTVTAGILGPTGQLDACTVTATSANANIYKSAGGVPVGAVCVNSIWIRRRTGTGTVILRNSNNVNIDITSQVDGTWKRFATAPVATPASTILVVELSVSGDAVDIAYAQFEQVDGQSNQAPGDYVSVGVLAAPYHGNAIDGVRYSALTNGNSVVGNVVTEAQGTLIPTATTLGFVAENAATNLCLQSQTFDDSTATGWTKTGAVVVNDATVAAPDGTLTADRITDDATNVIHRAFSAAITVTAVPYTFSVYAKAGTLSWLQLVSVSGGIWANFNVATGALGNKQGTATSSIVALPNGWYRCSVTGTGANFSAQVVCLPSDINAVTPTYVGTGQTMYLWGAQVEASSDPTSYIPTVAVSVTRNADSLSYPVTSNIDGAVATTYSEALTTVSSAAAGAHQNILYWNSGPFYPQYYDGATKKLSNYNGPVISTANARILGAMNKNASAWSGATVSVCLNGGAVATGAFTAYATSGVLFIGGAVGGQLLQGSIRNVKFYNVRIADADLVVLTAP